MNSPLLSPSTNTLNKTDTATIDFTGDKGNRDHLSLQASIQTPQAEEPPPQKNAIAKANTTRAAARKAKACTRCQTMNRLVLCPQAQYPDVGSIVSNRSFSSLLPRSRHHPLFLLAAITVCRRAIWKHYCNKLAAVAAAADYGHGYVR